MLLIYYLVFILRSIVFRRIMKFINIIIHFFSSRWVLMPTIRKFIIIIIIYRRRRPSKSWPSVFTCSFHSVLVQYFWNVLINHVFSNQYPQLSPEIPWGRGLFWSLFILNFSLHCPMTGSMHSSLPICIDSSNEHFVPFHFCYYVESAELWTVLDERKLPRSTLLQFFQCYQT